MLLLEKRRLGSIYAISIHLAMTVLRESLSFLPGNLMHMKKEIRVPPLDYEKSGKK